jgi:GR25 family glycosyltransferase involved in LPS biosynthesis
MAKTIKGLIIKVYNEGDEYVDRLLKSIEKTGSLITPEIIRATTPATLGDDLDLVKHIDTENLLWTWPVKDEENGIDLATGLYRRRYAAKNVNKVVACMISHMRAWNYCIDVDEPIVVFEHDALMTRKFFKDDILNDPGFKGGIVGLNDPRGATRKAALYHERISQKEGLQPTPIIDTPSDPFFPSGLAGNSAYLITPVGAK